MKRTIARIADHLDRLLHQAGRPINLGGRSYRLRGYISNNFAADSAHEPHLVEPLRRAFEARPGPFVDVGVNLGQTLSKVIALAPDRPYVGFEPQIAACFYVSRFLFDNGLCHMKIIPVGLSDQNGLVAFYAQGEADTMGSIVVDKREGNASSKHFVQTRIGDEVLAEAAFAEPGIIKIDVEGAEMAVLRGLTSTLETARPILFFEMLPNFVGHDRWMLQETQRTARNAAALALLEFLHARGYEIRQIGSDGVEHRIERFDLNSPDNFVGSDYVAYPV